MRYAACIEYDGAAFSGWQAQKHSVRTVQETVQAALSKVADSEITIITAGRTDASVHATHQIIHYDSDAPRTEFSWCRGTNRFLPLDVRVRWVVPIDENFHARFSALSRSYRYIINNNPIASALYRNHTSAEYRPLKPDLMAEAGKVLVGEHDFTSFRAAGCQAKSPIRTLHSFQLYHEGDWVWFDVTANAFLQHMVRNIAGSLIEVGCGKQPLTWLESVLSARDRTLGGTTASPNGLYLVGVDYPNNYSLPTKQKSVSFWGP